MIIKYYYNEQGENCERCGQFIKNVYKIEDNGIRMTLGCECIKKVSTISDFGIKIIKKAQDSIKDYQLELQDFLTNDIQMIKDKYFFGNTGMIEMTDAEKKECNYEFTYRPRTEEEFLKVVEGKIRMIPKYIENKEKELNKKMIPIKIKKQ